MTKIKRLAPQNCPECGQTGTLFIAQDKRLSCRACGYIRDAETDAANEPASEALTDDDRRASYQVSYTTPHTPDVDRWAKIKYTTGLDYAHRQEWDDALQSFEAAIEHQRDFVDAHLWAARMTLDPEEKRHHYGVVLAHTSNVEATRELMVLNGDLTRAEADRASDMSQEAHIQDAEHAVSTQLEKIVCSNCGGSLGVPVGQTSVTCQFCGHIETVGDRGQQVGQSLTMAMITDRGKGTRWRVGKHLLRCDSCGAERIITGKQMSVQCPFCGSHHVIKADALESFRQPDGVIPFSTTESEAEAALDAALNSFGERLKGIFVNNRADRITLTPVFLPFWVFDVTAKIHRTRIDNSSKRTFVQAQTARRREEFGDGLNNVLYCAVESPPRALTRRITRFDFDTTQAYAPQLLANKTAELYSIDYQQASLNVRETVSDMFRFRHGHDPHGDQQTLVSSLVQQMSFRLLMVPIWMVNIIEGDGDLRMGIIHGQTADAWLGQAQRPE